MLRLSKDKRRYTTLKTTRVDKICVCMNIYGYFFHFLNLNKLSSEKLTWSLHRRSKEAETRSRNELIHYFVWVGGKKLYKLFSCCCNDFWLFIVFFPPHILYNYWQTLTDPQRPDGLEESANETFAYRQSSGSLWKIGYSAERWHVEDESY